MRITPTPLHAAPASLEDSDYGTIATENLVPFSKMQPEIFKSGQLTPVRDLKLLIRDYAVSGAFDTLPQPIFARCEGSKRWKTELRLMWRYVADSEERPHDSDQHIK